MQLRSAVLQTAVWSCANRSLEAVDFKPCASGHNKVRRNSSALLLAGCMCEEGFHTVRDGCRRVQLHSNWRRPAAKWVKLCSYGCINTNEACTYNCLRKCTLHSTCSAPGLLLLLLLLTSLYSDWDMMQHPPSIDLQSDDLCYNLHD